MRRWIAEHREAPSIRQIAGAVGFSSASSVAHHLGNLEKRRGALVRDGRGRRTCRLVR
ncbi:LexA family protein [Streptomyces sp. NBC_00696]|uniref:LexA family protein n=1 Tax=Streptomyces sp. NBC_00696 TaxID=2903672 RepID=UPI0032439661